MRVGFVLRVIRQAFDRALAGECGNDGATLAAELASIVRDEWIDPETGKRRAVPKRCRMRPIEVALDLHGLVRGRHALWPRTGRLSIDGPPSRRRPSPRSRRAWF